MTTSNNQEKKSKKQTGWASLMQVLGVGSSTESDSIATPAEETHAEKTPTEPTPADAISVNEILAEETPTMVTSDEKISPPFLLPAAVLKPQMFSLPEIVPLADVPVVATVPAAAVGKKRSQKEPKVKNDKEHDSEKAKKVAKEKIEKEKKRHGRFATVELEDSTAVDEVVSRLQRDFAGPRQLAKAETEDELKAAQKILAAATATKPRSKVTAKDPWSAIAAQLGVVATEPPILASSVISATASVVELSSPLDNVAESTSPAPLRAEVVSPSSEPIAETTVELSDDDIFAGFAKAAAQRRLKNVFNITEPAPSAMPEKPDTLAKVEKLEKPDVAKTPETSEEIIPWEPKSSRPKSRGTVVEPRTPTPKPTPPPTPVVSTPPKDIADTSRNVRETSRETSRSGRPSDVAERVAPIYPERSTSERRSSESVSPTYPARPSAERSERPSSVRPSSEHTERSERPSAVRPSSEHAERSERPSSVRPSSEHAERSERVPSERPSRGRAGRGNPFSGDSAPVVELSPPSQPLQPAKEVDGTVLPIVVPTWNDAISTVRDNNMERHLTKKRQPSGGGRNRR